jgi:hypothetical protein
MTVDRDLERLLDVWLEDGPLAVADRVIDDTARRIARQPQRPAWRLRSGRYFHVITATKMAAGLAAVLVIAVIGIALILRPSGSKVGASSTTAAPTPSAAFPSGYPISPLLPAGNHATKFFTPRFTFTTPEGWINDSDSPDVYTLFPDTPANRAEFARTGDTAQGIAVASQLARPYFVCESWEDNRGATAAAMAAKVASNPALLATVTDVAIGGLMGKQVDVRLNPNWTQSCSGDPPGTDLSGARGRGFFLDRPGSPVLVILAPTDVAEAQAIIQSIVFSP